MQTLHQTLAISALINRAQTQEVEVEEKDIIFCLKKAKTEKWIEELVLLKTRDHSDLRTKEEQDLVLSRLSKEIEARKEALDKARQEDYVQWWTMVLDEAEQDRLAQAEKLFRRAEQEERNAQKKQEEAAKSAARKAWQDRANKKIKKQALLKDILNEFA